MSRCGFCVGRRRGHGIAVRLVDRHIVGVDRLMMWLFSHNPVVGLPVLLSILCVLLCNVVPPVERDLLSIDYHITGITSSPWSYLFWFVLSV